MSGRGDNAGGESDALAQMTNLPNLLTLTRIAAVPAIVWLLRDPSPTTAFWTLAIYIVAAVTDFFDGYLARRYGLTTTLGKLLDPLADKLLIVSALIMLSVIDRSPTVPGWLLVIIVGRELAVTGLRSIAANEGIVLAAEVSGKIKMILQAVGVGALILHYNYFGIDFYLFGMSLLVASTAVGLWSAVQYHVMVFRELAGRSR
jgi:CDP-diacylglycerol--glycerol-3-phosphate 3-phosphatidyltransferase